MNPANEQRILLRATNRARDLRRFAGRVTTREGPDLPDSQLAFAERCHCEMRFAKTRRVGIGVGLVKQVITTRTRTTQSSSQIWLVR